MTSMTSDVVYRRVYVRKNTAVTSPVSGRDGKVTNKTICYTLKKGDTPIVEQVTRALAP